MSYKAFLLCCLCLLCPINASAATFCVTDSDTFSAALLAAESNAEADLIKLAIGVYDAPIAGPFRLWSNENFAVEISGGWSQVLTDPCSIQLKNVNAFDTALIGRGTHRVMEILVPADSAMDVTIKKILFTNGFAFNQAGGGLFYPGSLGNASLVIEQCAFVNNQANSGAALTVFVGKSLSVSNSVFFGNHSTDSTGSTLRLAASNGFARGTTLINNTIIDNTSDISLGGVYAIAAGSAGINLVNNNIWNNTAQDVILSGDGARFFDNNNYGVALGLPVTQTDNISEAPVYEPGVFNYTPVEGSPLIDAGKSSPTPTPPPIAFEDDWSTGAHDVLGNPRVHGQGVDIGAYEAFADRIFQNGFE